MEPREVVRRFDVAVDTGDVEALADVCHPDMVTHSFAPNMPDGLDGMRAFVARRRSSGGVGAWDHVVTVADGEYVVQYGTRHWIWPGGRFRGFDAPAGRFVRDCAFMFRVRDGLITDRWAIRDDLAMMAQLGAIEPADPSAVMHGTITSHRADPFA